MSGAEGVPSNGRGQPPATLHHDHDATIRFRPHHFLCALGFVGKGYSDVFTANMARIVEGRLRGPGGGRTCIRVTHEADAICAPCPKRRGAQCASQVRIDALDSRHAAALGLADGDLLSWDTAQARIATRVAPADLDRLCAGCEWLTLGVCRDAVARLRA